MFRQLLYCHQLVLLMPKMSFYTRLRCFGFSKLCCSYPAANMTSEGLQLKDIILVHLYVKSMEDFNVINSIYVAEFDLCPPAR